MIIRQLTLLGICTLFYSQVSMAQTKTQDIKYTTKPISLEGGLDQFPSEAKLFVLSTPSSLSEPPSDNIATYYGFWDDQFLYFGVDVQDVALFCDPLAARDSAIMWSNDSLEFNFDTKKKRFLTAGDQDFRQWILPIDYHHNPYDAYGSGETGDPSFTAHAEVRFALNGTLNDDKPDVGYTVFIRIPWSDLTLVPVNDLSFGFDAGINDKDNIMGETTYLDWAALKTFAQPGRWGDLRLTGKPVVKPDIARPPSDSGVVQYDSHGHQDLTAGPDLQCATCTGKVASSGCDCSLADADITARGVGLIVLSFLALIFHRRRRC